MNNNKNGMSKTTLFTLQFICVYYWTATLTDSSSYYIAYLLCGLFGVSAVFYNTEHEYELRQCEYITDRNKLLKLIIMSLLFGVLVSYNNRLRFNDDISTSIALFVTGSVVCFNLILAVCAKAKIRFGIATVYVFYWLMTLIETGSYFIVYILCGIAGVASAAYNERRAYELNKRQFKVITVAAALFGAAVLLANYELFNGKFVQSAGVFISGGLICFNVILAAVKWIALHPQTGEKKERSPKEIRRFALISMPVMMGINLCYLFLCNYPGNLYGDSTGQIFQIINNTYMNNNPIYHTMLIRGCMAVGMALFNDINAAVAAYSVFQITLMAACFTYVLVTLYRAGLSLKTVLFMLAFYALIPYNIVYSTSMLKDPLFGASAALFSAVFFRVLKKIGNMRVNLIVLAISALFFGLVRLNGILALGISTVIFAAVLLCGKQANNQTTKQKGPALLLLAMFGAVCILEYPVLNFFNIQRAPVTETLTVPLQQISRTVVDGKELTVGEEEFLNHLIDVDELPDIYTWYSSDSVKGTIVTNEAAVEYLEEHKTEFIKMWLEIGLRNPGSYLKAWIDQTKGYWNGGYEYSNMVWIDAPKEITNDFGIEKVVFSESADRLFDSYFSWFQKTYQLRPLFSIGLHTWITAGALVVNIVLKRRAQAFMSIPALSAIFTLVLGAPLYSAFRYAYPLFPCLPLVLGVTFGIREPVLHENT